MARIGYLYEQDARDAEHMNLDVDHKDVPLVFIDMRGTNRLALTDLETGGGLMAGDTLVITAKSKLGHGQGATRIERKLVKMGVTVEVSPSPYSPKALRRKKRTPEGDDLVYLKGIWASNLSPDAAVASASKRMGFKVDRQWMNYNVCARDGGLSQKERQALNKKSKEGQG